MNARTASSGTSAIQVSTQPQTNHHVNKSVDFFFAFLIEWLPSLRPLLPKSPPHEQKPPYGEYHEQQPPTWVTPPMVQVSTQQPHRHYIYKYVAGGSKNNIRPFKYIRVAGRFHWYSTNKKKENSIALRSSFFWIMNKNHLWIKIKLVVLL